VLDLTPGLAELEKRWRSDKHLARNLRKAETSGAHLREAPSEGDLERFFALYVRTMRKLRALPRRRAHLALARRHLGERFRLFLVEHEGDAVAGGVFYAFGERLELVFSASDERRLDLRPNHLLYRGTIAWALEHGYRSYDFGGAGEGTGLASFKAQWGAEPAPCFVYGWTPDGSSGLAERQGLPGGRLVERAWDTAPLWSVRLAGSVGYRYL
jgi:CelD/BcsL family acetyltransferase involved in cellulose biosynthesis